MAAASLAHPASTARPHFVYHVPRAQLALSQISRRLKDAFLLHQASMLRWARRLRSNARSMVRRSFALELELTTVMASCRVLHPLLLAPEQLPTPKAYRPAQLAFKACCSPRVGLPALLACQGITALEVNPSHAHLESGTTRQLTAWCQSRATRAAALSAQKSASNALALETSFW